MSVIATVLKHLVSAGVTGDALVTAVAEIEEALETRNANRNSVTDVTPVTPAALRMRRMRERKSNEINVLDAEKAASVAVSESVTERNKSVTSYNNITSLEVDSREDKKDIIVRNVTRKRNSYAEAFETFWKAFPTDPGMSKSEASKAWDRLSPEDQQAAMDCIPAFKAWVAKQGESYRVVHACRYLSQRRFDGFKEQAAQNQERPVSSRVYVTTGTDAMDAWDAYYKRTKGKMAPRDQRGGWYFETEYPPHERAA